MTPEGRVKNLINKYLSTLRAPFSGVEIYAEMPVPSGYGKSGLDYTMCLWGHFVAIECKAPGEWLTPRQRSRALEIIAAGGTVFIISGPSGLQAFADWVTRCRKDFADTAVK
jgi:hypothetical protein